MGRSFNYRSYLELELKQYPEARADALIGVKLVPEDYDGWDSLGVANTKLKKYPEALKDFRIALTEFPRLIQAHLHRGTTLYAMGQKDEAKREWGYAFENGEGQDRQDAQTYLDNGAKSQL